MSKMDILKDSSVSARSSAMQNLQQMKELSVKLDTMPQHLSSQFQSLIQQLVAMQTEIQALTDQLQQLPSYLTNELSQQIEPLTNLPMQVQQMLTSFDQINEAQCRSLDELNHFHQQQLSEKLGQIDQAMRPLLSLPKALNQMVIRIDQSSQTLIENSQKLSQNALKLRSPWWKRMMSLVAAATLGAMLVPVGQQVLERPVPPSNEQTEVLMMRNLWHKATPDERKMIQEILNRQE